jgi:hypothetical protein
MKPKKSVLSQKPVLKKKKPLKAKSLLKKSTSKPAIKKSGLSEAADIHERAQWRKEKRDYWSSRFRRILADIAIKPKAKKSSFF